MKNIFLFGVIVLGMITFINAQSFDPVLASKLQNKIDSITTANNIKGVSACVIYPRMGTWKGVSGISHAGVPITSDMEFGIGSNTKLFTGVLLLKLAENNIIHLDDSLHQYLPNLRNIDPNITLRQLLNHTSGLADVTDVVGYSDSILSNPNRIFTPIEVMNWVGPPLFKAGTSWNYCNTNYLLAGIIAENATGRVYGQLLRDTILSPLQLDSTFLDVYDKVLYTIAHPWQAGTDQFSVPRKAINSVSWAAGAMYSTSGEMAQWFQGLMNGQVINSNSLNEMTTFVGSGKYGIGISEALVNGRKVWQHGGTIWGGYNTFMMYEPSSGIVICVFINQLPAQALPIARQLLTTIQNYPLANDEIIPNGKYYTVYPNPTNDLVSIDIPYQNLLGIKVFNANGQLVKESFETQFSISNLPTGIYFIKVHAKNGTYLSKLIIQK
jgi:D-alanyl-D-alanine carboxypeptidase